MTDHTLPGNTHLVELLVDRALFGLSHQENSELDGLLSGEEPFDEECFDRLAALIDLSLSAADSIEPMPINLRDRIAATAAQYLTSDPSPATSARSAPQLPLDDLGTSEAAVGQDRVTVLPRDSATHDSATGGKWGWLAAAACLMVAVGIWWAGRPASLPPIAAQREQLVATADDLIRVAWTATEDPAASGASGDVVWSNARQSGYMQFEGLAVNDASKQQYQLWIFDAQQDERYPIDGGVFDIDRKSGAVIVPIRAKLQVVSPTMFAVTVEKPGGVVVSDRSRLPLLAKVASVE